MAADDYEQRRLEEMTELRRTGASWYDLQMFGFKPDDTPVILMAIADLALHAYTKKLDPLVEGPFPWLPYTDAEVALQKDRIQTIGTPPFDIDFPFRPNLLKRALLVDATELDRTYKGHLVVDALRGLIDRIQHGEDISAVPRTARQAPQELPDESERASTGIKFPPTYPIGGKQVPIDAVPTTGLDEATTGQHPVPRVTRQPARPAPAPAPQPSSPQPAPPAPRPAESAESDPDELARKHHLPDLGKTMDLDEQQQRLREQRKPGGSGQE